MGEPVIEPEKPKKNKGGRPAYLIREGQAEANTFKMLVDRLAAHQPFPRATIHTLVNAFYDEIAAMLLEDLPLRFTNIGELYVRHPKKESMLHHNRKTRQWEMGLCRKHIKFKESATMYEKLNDIRHTRRNA